MSVKFNEIEIQAAHTGIKTATKQGFHSKRHALVFQKLVFYIAKSYAFTTQNTLIHKGRKALIYGSFKTKSMHIYRKSFITQSYSRHYECTQKAVIFSQNVLSFEQRDSARLYKINM